MSKHDDAMTISGRADLLYTCGEALSYTAFGAAAVSITGIWEWAGEQGRDEGDDGAGENRRARVTVSMADVDPESITFDRDLITRSGLDYAVKEISEQSGGMVELLVQRWERVVSRKSGRIRERN